MEQKDYARNKIILLYIINRLPGISISTLTGLAIDTCYMNYFTFASIVDDLIQDKLITKSTRKNENSVDSENKPVIRCDITESGLSVLTRLDHMIPDNLHAFLAEHIKTWETNIRKESEITSTYQPDLYGSYIVTLKLSDGIKDIVLINLTVPTKVIAENICTNWKSKPQENYLGILGLLTT